MSRYLVIILVLFSYTGISVGKIGKALLTPFHLVMGVLIVYAVFFTKKNNKNVLLTLLVLIGYLVGVNILSFPNIRFTSILYSVIYAIEMLIVYHFLKRNALKDVLLAFRIILFSYTANLFLGNLFDIIGFHNDFISAYIRVHHTANSAIGRPMGFSSEPSYAAYILSVVFLCYNHLKKHEYSKEILQLGFVYIFSILMMKSAYGFIFVAVILLDWGIVLFKRSNLATKMTFPFIALLSAFLLIITLQNSKNETITRLHDVSAVSYTHLTLPTICSV